MIGKELVLKFFKENLGLTILFIIITTLSFPVEAIGIPKLYGEMFSDIKNYNYIKKVIIAVILLYLFVQVFYSIKNLLYSKIIPRYLEFTRKTLFKKIIENYETEYQDIKLGKNIALLFDLTRDLKNIVGFFIDRTLPLFITVIFVFLYFTYLDWNLGLLIAILFIGFGLLFYYLSVKVVNISAVREAAYLEMTEKVHDSFDNLMNIYLNNEKDNEIDKSDSVHDVHTKLYQKQIKMFNVMQTSLSFYSVFFFIAIIGFSFYKFRKGIYNTKNFISIALILIYFLGFLLSLSREVPDQLLNLGIVKCSQTFLEDILKGKSKTFIDLKKLDGNIEFKNLTFQYNKEGKKLFNNFNLVINKGQKVAIIGSSGSGKTTLMKLLLKLHNPTNGQITIGGVNINKINPSLLRKDVNYINQRTGLFSNSVLNNIKYGNDITDKQIITLLQKYELDQVFSQLRRGVYTDVGVQGKNVSLGMQKVIMNVRGLLKKGKIVILDEPLAGLDAKTRVKMIKFIKDICEGKTLIVITHDKEIIPIMDKVINLNNRFTKT